jgi:hypothetical protein
MRRDLHPDRLHDVGAGVTQDCPQRGLRSLAAAQGRRVDPGDRFVAGLGTAGRPLRDLAERFRTLPQCPEPALEVDAPVPLQPIQRLRLGTALTASYRLLTSRYMHIPLEAGQFRMCPM